MPKEYINNRYFGQDVDGAPIDESAVKVGWSREAEHVEVAVIRDYGLGGDGSGDWHAQMDRAGLNRLIRALRKARDAAFGADA